MRTKKQQNHNKETTKTQQTPQTMATIKRHLVYLTLTIIASLNCQAQLRYNVYVTNDKGIALGNVSVYSFALRKNA